MKPLQRLLSLVVTITIAGASSLTAQDLAINNVRIIVGTGQVIEQGTIVIRGGRIVSASAGNTAAPGVRALDGKGLTAVAGYIDAHRHIVQGGGRGGRGAVTPRRGSRTTRRPACRNSWRLATPP